MNRFGKTLLVLALVAVVGMAFRVSWNALRDVARTIGADHTAAILYPFVVDGLMALALIATLVLTDRADKRFALRVLAAYTLASLVLNYVHGLVPALHHKTVDWGRLAAWDPANWLLVLLATSLPVGSIYFGSDLVAKVLHHRPEPVQEPAVREACGETRTASAHRPHTPETLPIPAAPALPETAAEEVEEGSVEEAYAQVSGRAGEGVREIRTSDPHTSRTPQPDPAVMAQFEEAELERTRQDARRTYAESVQAGHPLSARALGEAYGLSESWGRKQILAVREEQERPRLVAVGD